MCLGGWLWELVVSWLSPRGGGVSPPAKPSQQHIQTLCLPCLGVTSRYQGPWATVLGNVCWEKVLTWLRSRTEQQWVYIWGLRFFLLHCQRLAPFPPTPAMPMQTFSPVFLRAEVREIWNKSWKTTIICCFAPRAGHCKNLEKDTGFCPQIKEWWVLPGTNNLLVVTCLLYLVCMSANDNSFWLCWALWELQ